MDVRWIFLFTLFCGIEFAVRAELSTSSCSLLRTATSVATMVPEFARLAMRYYSSSSSVHQHRAKRFLFQDNNAKNTGLRGTVLDQMVANAFKDVNYTKVAVLLFHNPESLAKLRKNFNADVIVRAMMQEIDYERLGQSLWYAAEAEFDLERFLHTIINITHIDLLHEEMVTNGTIPEWFIKSLHSDLNVHTVNQMFSQLKNFTYKLVGVLSSSERLDDYLFKTIQQQILTPMNTMVQRVKEQKPSTLDQLVEVILSNVNRVLNEQWKTTTPMTKKPAGKGTGNKSSTVATATVDSGISDDLQLLFYQCSIAVESAGQTIRTVFKALEQLYCASVWE